MTQQNLDFVIENGVLKKYNGNSMVVVVPEGVTSIGDWAFVKCYNMTSITLPSSVTSIGAHAFCFCYGLTSITIPDSVTAIGDFAFSECRSLEKIYIPNSVTSIGESAFSGCNMKSITLPNNVTSIRNGTFSYCYNLKTVQIPEGVTAIGNSVFYQCNHLVNINIPESVTSIGDFAFQNCSSLQSLHLPEGVSAIGEGAFKQCSLLSYISLPSGIEYIPAWAFAFCINLANIEIPASVTSIGDLAFWNCTRLQKLQLPGKLRSIGKNAFTQCNTLSGLIIPSSVEFIDESAFAACASLTILGCQAAEMPQGWASAWLDGCPATVAWSCFEIREKEDDFEDPRKIGSKTKRSEQEDEDILALYEQIAKQRAGTKRVIVPFLAAIVSVVLLLTVTAWYQFFGPGSFVIENGVLKDYRGFATSVVIPEGVTAIDDAAFFGCTNINNVYIPDSVTYIGSYAFSTCQYLQSVTIPEGVTTIGNAAFQYCSSLKNVTIPQSVTSIGGWAFEGCTRLEEVTIMNGVTSIGDCAFYGCKDLVSIAIPNSMNAIGNWAFSECWSLTSIFIPESVRSFGKYAFLNCYNLGTVYCEAESKPYGWNSSWLYGCRAYVVWNSESAPTPPSTPPVSEFVIENGVLLEYKGSSANVVIPDSVTSIGENAFYGCSYVKTVSIPYSVTSINHRAFYGCSGLNSIKIPSSISYMGSFVFAGCTNLKTIYCAAYEMPNGWNNYWNDNCSAEIVWNYKGTYTPPIIPPNTTTGTTKPTATTKPAATTTAATTTAATTTAATTTAQTTTGVVIPPTPQMGAPVLNLDFENLNNMASGATVVGPVASIQGYNGGNAAHFGQGDEASYIQVPNSDALNFTTSDEFTIDFWYKLDATKNTVWENLFCKGNKNNGWYGVWVSTNDGATRGVCWGGDTGNHMVGSMVSREVWHRITVIMKDGIISTYLDGTLVKDNIAAKDYTSTTDLFIGGSTPVDGNQQFHGAIDDFRIYDYAWNEVYAVAPGVEAEKPVEPPAEPTLEDKIYADIDFLADGTMVDLKGKLDLAIKGEAKVETKDVTHNGTTIQLPTFQANGANVATATFKEFTDANTAMAFWNSAEGFSLEAFYVCRGASAAVEGVFCATENPSATGRSGVGIAMKTSGAPYLCLGLTDNSYLSVVSSEVASKTEFVHVIATGIYADGKLTAKVYVNGKLTGTGEKAAQIEVTDINKTLVIGGDTNANASKVDFPHDDFSVADIKVYSAALTAEDVAEAYALATSAFIPLA